MPRISSVSKNSLPVQFFLTRERGLILNPKNTCCCCGTTNIRVVYLIGCYLPTKTQTKTRDITRNPVQLRPLVSNSSSRTSDVSLAIAKWGGCLQGFPRSLPPPSPPAFLSWPRLFYNWRGLRIFFLSHVSYNWIKSSLLNVLHTKSHVPKQINDFKQVSLHSDVPKQQKRLSKP